MRIGAEQRGDLRAGGVSGEEQPLRIAAVFAGMRPRPCHRIGCVVHERRKAGGGIRAVVGDDGEDAVAGEALADEAVLRAAAALPGAAIEEHHRRRAVRVAAAAGSIDIERKRSIGRVDDARVGLWHPAIDESKEHAFATTGQQSDQGEHGSEQQALWFHQVTMQGRM